MHEPTSVGLDGFADPQSNEVMIQCCQTIEIGLIVEGVGDVLKVFPGMGTGQIHDPILGIRKV